MSVFPAVAASVPERTCRTAKGREDVSPMTRNRIPCLSISGSSLRRNSCSRAMRVFTSASGRPQFSREKAYRVR